VFTVNDLAPETFMYKKDVHERVSLLETVIGPNASGKTNVIKAIAFIKHLIAYSASDDVEKEILTMPYADNDKPTELSVRFSIGSRLFEYRFSVTRKRILKEALREQSLTAARITSKTLFSRQWKNGRYEVVNHVFKVSPDMNWRHNASMVSQILLAQSEPFAAEIVGYWRKNVVTTNVWYGGNRDDRMQNNDGMTKHAIEDLYRNTNLLTSAKDILRSIDVGFDDFEREELQIEQEVHHRIRHKYARNNFAINLDFESSGTKRTIVILRDMLRALSVKGGFAAIDELDAYLHPDIVEALVKLFMSPETNPNRSQLLFTSHSHRLLSEFDKQQITLVEKNDDGETEVWRLDDMTGVRADDNYYTKYIAGAYGARPKVTI
jgi:AAA15 family ATPase/GTPase